MNITFNQFNQTKYPYLDDSYIDKYIPVAYGKIASVQLTPINSNKDSSDGTVSAVYRMPDGMTDYGTAYIEVDDTWKTATVESVDYDTGLITISNGRASSGSTYTCKLVDCYGYMFDGHCYPRQALQHWYATYGGIQYTDSNFNKTEWVAALDNTRYQADFGLLLNDYSKDEDSDNSYDLDYFNKVVYNIATFGGKMYCRVDYDLSGKITATLKDYDRTASDTIASADIYDNNTLSASTTADSAYAIIVEKYYHNTVDDNYLSLEDNTYERFVKQNYRIMQSLTDKSYLINETDAKSRAAELALEYKYIPVEFEINVRDRYTTRLYDVVTVALMPDNLDSSMRQYAGNKDCLVTGVAPLPDKGYTTLTLQIIPDRTPSTQQAAVRNSAYTTVARDKSSVQLITDNLASQISDNLLLSGSLSVPTVSLAATSDGTVSDFSAATGTFNVKYSGTDVTGDGPVYSVVSQTGCTGAIDAATGVYAVSALSADVGILLLKATYESKSIETSFTVTKAYAGAAGTNGTRTASIEMYKWASSAPTTYPVGTSTYTWATGAFANPATLNGWSQTIGTGAAGQTLYRVRAVYADTSTTATSAITWPTSPTVETVSNYASDGSDGVDGVNGTRTAILEVYKWAASTPTSFPSGTSTYTWATGTFTAPTTANGWSINPGASTAGYTLYACQMKYADSLTGATSTVTWSTSTAYAVGAAGTNGINGTDSTAITISDPDSTTPESGMTYDNTYYGIYSGIWYKWSWSSTTTGAWTQVSADTPPTPAVRYSFDEMPDLPDESGDLSGNVVVNMHNYTVTDNGSGSFTCVASGADPYLCITKMDLGITAPFILCYDVFVSELNGNVPTAEGYMWYTDGTYSGITQLVTPSATEWRSCRVLLTPTSGKTVSFIRLDLISDASSATSTVQLKNIYVGYGATSQPIIDNISGVHNSIAQSGVVSTTGVSGKACQFLGYRAISLDLSAYANVQSWWESFWIKPDSTTSTKYIHFLGNKEYMFYDSNRFGSESYSPSAGVWFSCLVNPTTLGLFGSAHHCVVQNILTSSLATKRMYIDGVLVKTVTSTIDFTSLTFGTGYIGGDGVSSNVMSGYLDDFQFGVGEITATQVLGLYLQRASAAKLYTLADYNYDKSVSSWEITSSAASLSKSRAGVVTPSTVTFSAKAVIASVAQAYSGRFIIYTSTDGTTFTQVYPLSGDTPADESSHAYSPASGIVAIRVELYKSGGTSVLVATKDYSVPYDASVKPQYLGIGLLADVNGLTTKAFTGATITDAGVITPNGATTTAVITGDWLINYSAGTYRAKGIYYWSGSAWTITSDSKYTSDGVIEDICRLNNRGILIPDWTVYVNLIADNLFSHKIKLTTKTISDVTYAGVFYGGDRFNADGSIADRTANGFYFKTDGKGWCNLQSDDLYNTIIGTNAGLQLISGSGNLGKFNSIYGMEAGYKLTTGYYNTINGARAGYSLTAGDTNTLNGMEAGYNLTTGYSNTINGASAGYKLTTGNSNTINGAVAGYNLTTGVSNTINGAGAGYDLTTGNSNTLNGARAGYNLTTGYSNTINGVSAGYNLTTGNSCLFDGYNTYAYNSAWNYQINLNNCLIFLPFSADATLGTVFSAVYHYLANVGSTGCMGFHSTHSIVTANVYSTYIDFKDLNDNTVLSVASESKTLLGSKMFLWFPNYSLNAGNV